MTDLLDRILDATGDTSDLSDAELDEVLRIEGFDPEAVVAEVQRRLEIHRANADRLARWAAIVAEANARATPSAGLPGGASRPGAPCPVSRAGSIPTGGR